MSERRREQKKMLVTFCLFLALVGATWLSFRIQPPVETEPAATFHLVREEIEDLPIKTQIVHYVAVVGVPTAFALRSEILDRYHALQKRQGLRWRTPPTNIGVYIYGGEADAQAGNDQWLGMLFVSHENETPKVMIDEARLNSLAHITVSSSKLRGSESCDERGT